MSQTSPGLHRLSPFLRLFRSLLPLIFFYALLLGTGCTSPPQKDPLALVHTHYRAGNFAQARTEALTARNSATPETQHASSYMAALCSYRLHEASTAQVQLQPALSSSRPDIRANAQALLGLIHLENGHPEQASPLLYAAASQLKGWDATQARRFADRACELSEETPVLISSPVGKRSTHTRSASPGAAEFTIQLGAFREKSRADQTADQARSIARSLGLNPVRIVPRTDPRGRNLYLVQLGHFSSRSAANLARKTIGHPNSIVSRQAH